MLSLVFNGSYIARKNTGIGVVSKELSTSFSKPMFTTLIPKDIGLRGDICIPNNFSPHHGFKGHLRRMFWVQSKLPQIIKNLNADYLFSPLLEAPLFTNVKSIVLAHDLIPLRYPSSSILTLFYLTYIPLVLQQSKLIFCNSISTANDLKCFYKVPQHKLFPIKLGFNNEKYYPTKHNKENFFLIIGRHNPHKNLERILSAFALSNQKGYKLVFVGPFDKRYTPKLLQLTNDLNIGHLCEWRGWIGDHEKLVLLNQCKALIIASLWEGFGLPALEAMACGTPVIASNKGALPEVVADCGILINPLDTCSIASAINQIIHDDIWVNNVMKKGPHRAASFSWLNTTNQIEKIIKENH